MEILAFTHAAEAHEDPSPAPELRDMSALNSGIVGALGTVVVAGAVLGGASDAQALIMRGDTGPAVSSLQKALVNAGFNPGGVDGVFGANTERAVRNFQASKSLSVDGVVGPATAAALGIDYDGGGGGGGGGAGRATVIASSGLNVRSGPGTGFAIIDTLPFGATVNVVVSSGGWSRLSDGGFVAERFLDFSGTGGGGGGATGNATVAAASGLNVRSGPGTGFAIIDTLSPGDRVTVVSSSGGWSLLSGGGYVATRFLDFSGTGGGGGGGATGNATVAAASGLNVRSGPGTGFAIIDTLSPGDRVTVVSSSGGWSLLSGGGYVATRFLDFGGGGGGGGGGAVGGATVVAPSGLNIRSGAGTSFPIIGFLSYGETVDVVEVFEGWAELSGGGFVSADWLAF